MGFGVFLVHSIVVSVLLSASVKRCYRTRDFSKQFCPKISFMFSVLSFRMEHKKAVENQTPVLIHLFEINKILIKDFFIHLKINLLNFNARKAKKFKVSTTSFNKECTQKVSTKSTHKKCPQNVSTKSVKKSVHKKPKWSGR